jgi:hypothetical protein
LQLVRNLNPTDFAALEQILKIVLIEDDYKDFFIIKKSHEIPLIKLKI